MFRARTDRTDPSGRSATGWDTRRQSCGCFPIATRGRSLVTARSTVDAAHPTVGAANVTVVAARATVVLVAVATIAAAGCTDDPAVPPAASEMVARYGLETMPPMVHPPDNPPNAHRIALGRLLFFDPVQSAHMDVACATCHLPRFAFTDGRNLPAGPSGIGLGPDRTLTDSTMVEEGRNSPTVINVGFNRFFRQTTTDGFLFWDGRKRKLENLVTLPQREFSEMRASVYPVELALDSVIARLRSLEEYEAAFGLAYPDRAADVAAGRSASAIDSATIAMSIAQFIRSLEGVNSPYDRFVRGEDGALTEQQKRGLVLFHEKGRCVECHVGPMFSDFNFHVVGARQLGPGFQETPHEDLGRWNATRLDADRYRFRTPSLRNVAETAPYMHSGGYASLREAVEFFDRGGGDHPHVPTERLELRPLHLTPREIDALVAFLEALTDLPDVDAPDRVPSGLIPPR